MSKSEFNVPTGKAFAPVNIALCKYWGKRDTIFNLPMTGSLSISLGEYGARTLVQIIENDNEKDTGNDIKENIEDEIESDMGNIIENDIEKNLVNDIGYNKDRIQLNGQWLDNNHPDAIRIIEFLDLFRELNTKSPLRFQIKTDINVPVASGLASSAAGFAALTLALNDLFDWKLNQTQLSIIARIGSGSACRSFWPGFVQWHKGVDPKGLDSHGEALNVIWKDFRIGLLILSEEPKPISSRAAMLQTQKSPLYAEWPKRVEQDLDSIKKAVYTQNFALLGETSEANALAMHALMKSANPPIIYSTEKTIAAYHQVWQLRAEGTPVYFTQDAGPHLKLLFLTESTARLKQVFPELIIIDPFISPQVILPKAMPTHVISPNEDDEHVVLVDANDKVIGTENKLRAHQLGLLHRAFSIFIYRKTKNGVEFLLQKRHSSKYHCGGLWSNACCSHPRLNENIFLAAKRRLNEELFLNIDIPLTLAGSFEYRAILGNGLIEHELDTVLLGEYDESTHGLHHQQFNTLEIEAITWMTMKELLQAIEQSPQQFTPWLKPALNKVKEVLCTIY